MKAAATTGVDGLHPVVEERLRRVDQRYTAGRRAIVDLLVDAGHPVSIGDIADLNPSLPRSSAYRHLVDLQSAGIVRRVAANDEFARFELAEDFTEHHHHLCCTNCGKVVDITLSAGIERSLDRHLGDLCRDRGFQAISHRVDVMGLCQDCR